MLLKLLSADDYSLGLSPGFFRFYAHIGVLKALEEKGCLRASEVTGSSAGALVGSFLCAGFYIIS
jgi:NTE family protein